MRHSPLASLVASCADPSTSAPSLGGRYPLHRYYGPIRLPSPASVSPSRDPSLAAAAAGVGLPCCVIFLADVPSPLPRRTRRTRLFGASDSPLYATAAAFPLSQRGRRPLGIVSRPARRSLLLRPVCLLSHHVVTLFVRSFSRFVTSSTVPTATGWNDQPPGRDSHPLENDTFARRTG